MQPRSVSRRGRPGRSMELEKGAAGRYTMLVGKHYYNAYQKNNPAGLANDAGSKHANATCNNAGTIRVKKRISKGDEIYFCYHQDYWRRWGPRLPLQVGAGERGPAPAKPSNRRRRLFIGVNLVAALSRQEPLGRSWRGVWGDG